MVKRSDYPGRTWQRDTVGLGRIAPPLAPWLVAGGVGLSAAGPDGAEGAMIQVAYRPAFVMDIPSDL
jgi:hypothetical protein